MARLFAPQRPTMFGQHDTIFHCSAHIAPSPTSPWGHCASATVSSNACKAIHHHVCATVICQRHKKTFDHTDIVPCQRKGGTVAIYREPSHALLEPGTPALRVNACVTWRHNTLAQTFSCWPTWNWSEPYGTQMWTQWKSSHIHLKQTPLSIIITACDTNTPEPRWPTWYNFLRISIFIIFCQYCFLAQYEIPIMYSRLDENISGRKRWKLKSWRVK